MDNWPQYLVLALALGGNVYFLSQPLPVDYRCRSIIRTGSTGESVTEVRLIYYALQRPQDTAYV